jgi:hypothetical protein
MLWGRLCAFLEPSRPFCGPVAGPSDGRFVRRKRVRRARQGLLAGRLVGETCVGREVTFELRARSLDGEDTPESVVWTSPEDASSR